MLPLNIFEPRYLAMIDAGRLEAEARRRWWRLANAAFRDGAPGWAAVYGFTVLRRIERANLITLSEGIRLGVEPGALRAYLTPAPEAAHV